MGLIRIITVLLLSVLTTPGLVSTARADVRIKDMTEVQGIRDNQLTGFGLVVGLNNTGGRSPITRRFATNFEQQFGIRLDPALRAKIRTDTREITNNMSVVTVTANLPAFKTAGQRIDVTVAAFDDATSLSGGILIATPLFGHDDEVYAVASGPVSVDSIVATGQAASVQKNHPTAGRVIAGGLVEREVCTTIAKDGCVRLMLRDPDFETATRIVAAINKWTPGTCKALDPGTVELTLGSSQPSELTTLLAQIGQLTIKPDVKAKVVINERTGTIVIGENVRLSHVLITHSNLAIFTTESPEVSQPQPFSDGKTTVVPRTDVEAVEENSALQEIPETATVGDLATALNALGVAPRDLGVIFQQLRDSGALHAELEFK